MAVAGVFITYIAIKNIAVFTLQHHKFRFNLKGWREATG